MCGSASEAAHPSRGWPKTPRCQPTLLSAQPSPSSRASRHLPAAATHLACFRFTRPGRPPPKGLVSAKSMCFWLSTRTMKEGTLTVCLPTLRHRKACGSTGRRAAQAIACCVQRRSRELNQGLTRCPRQRHPADCLAL
jgi:hypothetical protein